uniref:BZIP domain-containing protein n=1 Tax=Amphora coffeiformis TaxID=265554 RepID=A0A7S3P7D5_9STRA
MSADAEPADPLQLAYAVAALQSDSTVMGLLTTVPQTLGDPISKTPLRDSTKQTAGSGTNEESCGSSARSTSPDSLSQQNDDGGDKRLARSRERNREHARRTRLRKKAHLEALQSKVKGLEAERQVLKQNIEECGIASILLGLSAGDHEAATSVELNNSAKNDGASQMVALLATGKRKRFLSEAMAENQPTQTHTLKLDIDGEETTIGGGKTSINWKTGVYRDENGKQKQLSAQQLENLRRERNRMHAKMTRDRKKCFIVTIEKTIEDLENENNRMRSLLSKLASSKFSQLVTPMNSPDLSPSTSPPIPGEDEDSTHSQGGNSGKEVAQPTPKKARHGFRLDL